MKKIISAVLFIFSANIQAEINLLPGTNVAESIVDSTTLANRRFAAEMASLIPGNKAIMKAFTNLGTGNIYYTLYSDMHMRQFDVLTKQYLGGWPLTRTPDDQKAPISQFFEGNTRESVEQEYTFQVGNYNDSALGCLWDTPLRYGDLEQDATNELVLLLGYDRSDKINRQLDIVIFSPQQQKVIFSSRLAREDIGPLTTEAFANYTRMENPGKLPTISSSDTSTGLGNPAVRAYSKLYLGDFDDNGKQDILVWRKRYDSKSIEDAVQGYALRKELLSHHELNGGEYSAQPTEEITIKEWLTNKHLTWQKGYPSQSECPGQENQLIPEMHDPLLNDADVLK